MLLLLQLKQQHQQLTMKRRRATLECWQTLQLRPQKQSNRRPQQQQQQLPLMPQLSLLTYQKNEVRFLKSNKTHKQRRKKIAKQTLKLDFNLVIIAHLNNTNTKKTLIVTQINLQANLSASHIIIIIIMPTACVCVFGTKTLKPTTHKPISRARVN